MAEILLIGIEMPKDDVLRLEIYPNGDVHRIIGWAISEKKDAKAIEVPNHGRLGDLDKLKRDVKNYKSDVSNDALADIARYCTGLADLVSNTPTVIEASRKGK